MRLQYFGHSCFRLISDTGTTVVCDPFDKNMVGFEMPKVRCDVVTVSHHHKDHDCEQNIIGSYAVLDKEISCAADDIAIQSFSTFHDDEKGAKRGTNLVFTFLIDGIKVVHLGDIGFLDEKIVAQIRGCDVLLLPVGGVYTIDAKTAKLFMQVVCPKIVVPMHYHTSEHNFYLDGLQNFLQLLEKSQVQQKNSYQLILDDVPQNEDTQVVVLQRYQE